MPVARVLVVVMAPAELSVSVKWMHRLQPSNHAASKAHDAPQPYQWVTPWLATGRTGWLPVRRPASIAPPLVVTRTVCVCVWPAAIKWMCVACARACNQVQQRTRGRGS